MAVGGTIGLEASAWTEAAEAVEARLREAGFRVDDSGLPRRDDCTSVECLRTERASRDVDVLVTITIFAAEGGDGAAGSVVVAMVDADGRYVGEESVDGRVIGVVAALALAAARQERERGPEPWVRVAGSPTGAIVRIDGREVGVVPFEGRLAAGEHVVEISLGGHEPFSRRFTARGGSTETIDVALRPTSGAGIGADARVAIVVPSAIVLLAGVVMGSIAIANGSQVGACAPPPRHVFRSRGVRRAGDRPRRRRRLGGGRRPHGSRGRTDPRLIHAGAPTLPSSATLLPSLAVAVLLMTTGCPALASAQDAPSVSIMAVGGTIGLEASAWTEAADAVEARLREAGFRVDDSGLPRRDDCTSVECLRTERASRDVDVLVTITIFAAEGGDGAPGSVVVAMVDADGRYVGEESVDGRVIGVVAALALAAARQERERGPEPWVRVAGSPTGAIVRIDGREVGVVPFEGRVAAGEHDLEVSLGGYETFTRRFTARGGSTEAVDVSLTATGGGGSGGGVGTALVGTGVALAIAGLASFVVGGVIDGMEGSCTRPDGGRCAEGLEQTDLDTGFYVGGGIGLGIGVPLIVIGLVIE